MRRRRIVLVAGALALAIVATACSGSSKKHSRPGATTSTAPGSSTTGATAASVTLRVVRRPAAVVAVGAHGRLDGIERAADGVVNRYLQLASVAPLQRGRLGDGITALFTPGAAARLRTTDATVLTDAALGSADASAELVAATKLTTLVDANGRAIEISAGLQERFDATTVKGRFTVVRSGELVLVPVGPSWRISGYDLTLTRTDRVGTTTTTAATTTTTGGRP